MTLLPINNEALWTACKKVAQENYGLLYMDADKNVGSVIKEYKNAQKKPLKASTINRDDLTKFLTERAKEEHDDESLTKLRESVYFLRESVYFIPVVFGEKDLGDLEIEKLTDMFKKNIVVSTEMIRKEFEVAFDDGLFFANELANRSLIKPLSEGGKYYVMGDTLKDSVSTDLFKMAIGNYANDGLITPAGLEEAIKVDATNDVIRYLEKENILVKVNSRYLVHGMTVEFSEKVAEEIKGSVEERFKEYNYVVNETMIRGVIEENINERYNISDDMIKEEVVSSVLDQVIMRCGFDRMHDGILVESIRLDQLTDEEAEKIYSEIKNEKKLRDVLTFDALEMKEDADRKISAELYLNPDTTADQVIKEKIKEKCNLYIDKYFDIMDKEA